MAIVISSPVNSFIQFNPTEATALCIWGTVNFCLPVFADEDIYFQFIATGTAAEIDAICTTDGGGVELAIVRECGEEEPLIMFAEKPVRYRLSPTQALFNWSHGLPGFVAAVAVGECVKIQVTVDVTPYGYPEEIVQVCSNCLQRIASDCFTSVIEYGNDEDGFGFKYCGGGEVPVGPDNPPDCSPTIVQFVGVPTLSIPYTAVLSDKYGDFPTVQVWIYDGTGQLLNMGITAAFDTYPPTMINIDTGGVSSGIVVIR